MLINPFALFSFVTNSTAESALSNSSCEKTLPVGGQAVIEGVIMKGPSHWGMAVRKPEGDIYSGTDGPVPDGIKKACGAVQY